MKVSMTVVAGLAILQLVLPCETQSQESRRIRVVDGDDRAVAFAFVQLGGGISRVADDSGIVYLSLPRRDSVLIRARRIGYRPFDGWVDSRPSASPVIRMSEIARSLDAVTVVERANTPLSRTGFYDRLQRVQRGAIVGEFITPEELDARGSSQTSQLLVGRRYVHIRQNNSGGRARYILLGRGGCPMTIIVDGQRMANVLGENMAGDVPSSINPGGTARNDNSITKLDKLDINELVEGRSIMAIEVYPSTANAPAELQTLGGRGSCGIVAIWTGPRA